MSEASEFTTLAEAGTAPRPRLRLWGGTAAPPECGAPLRVSSASPRKPGWRAVARVRRHGTVNILAEPVLRSVTCCSWFAPCSHSNCSASASSEMSICGKPSSMLLRVRPRVSRRACRDGAF